MTKIELPKVKIKSPDMNEKRLSELYRIMPDLFDSEGQLDETQLRSLFPSDQTIRMEKFRFEWVGKQESKYRSFTSSLSTLVADEQRSVNFEKTKNLFVEGDNLEVMKLLQTTYFEQVKCIYIDPPYNTGTDFIYQDNFVEEKKAYWQKTGTVKEGVKLVALTETNGRRHSKWLNMMQSRLYAARNLLRQDGAIIIHIDENEGHRLRMLLEEVFGDTNFLGEIIWDKRNPKGDSGKVSYQHESVLIFAKNIMQFREQNQLTVPKRNAVMMLKKASHYFSMVGKKITRPRMEEALAILGIEETEEHQEIYTLEDANHDYQKWLKDQGQSISGGEAAYKFIDDQGKVYREVSMAWPNSQPAPRDYLIPLTHPLVGKPCPVPSKGWRNPPQTMKKLLDRDQIVFGEDETTQPRRKYLLEENMTENLASLLYYGSSDEAKLKKMGIRFDHPKPVEVAKRLMMGFLDHGDIVMDFFAGSGTTGHAIMEMNSEYHKDIRFILIQIPETINGSHGAFKAGYKTVSNLCIDRLKKVGENFLEHASIFLDVGFRVYHLTESYFPENKFKPNPSKSPQENRSDFKKYLESLSQARLFNDDEFLNVITEISLKNGYGLFYTLHKLDEDFVENSVYQLTGNDKDTLLCLDLDLKEETVNNFVDHYSDHQLILSADGLDSGDNWILRKTFGDCITVV